MRTTRTLAIVSALGLGMAFVASANVVYDSETTNAWFGVNMSTLKTSDLSENPWAPPKKGGEAAVVVKESANVIRLDTDLDDPLTYAASGSADVAVVAAEMTATVNATEPQIAADPQAALAVIGDATTANWAGLVGDGNGGTEWVTFQSPVPVAGNSYSVRIEFDQRATKRIRYLVDGVILSGEGSSDGWYPNPQADAAKISNVSFSGSGDIKALAGENITENTIAFKGLTQTNGFDYTNGTIKISADIQGYENVKAVLKLVDFGTGSEKPPVEYSLGNNTPVSWDLSALTAGGTYAYTIEAKDAGGNVIATKTGTFTAAHWPTEWPDIWFGADATSGAEVKKGGKWDLTKEQPVIEGNVYVIEDDALFNVTDQKPGSNHVTRVDTKVTFETLVDSSSLDTPEDVALGGFVAAKSGENPQWMALTANNGPAWVALTGDITPTVNEEYVIRAEVDFISDTKRVRFLVSDDDGATFHPLSGATSQWIDLATQEKYSLAAVELKGSGRVAKFEATVADRALAVVDGVEYDSMEEALAAAKKNGKTIELLTNATIEPKEKGSYDIAPGTHQYVSGGRVSSEERTIVVDDPTKPPVVRPGKTVMEGVKTPDRKSYKDISSLRAFLERNNVEAYQNENAESSDIQKALQTTPQDAVNNLALWQDYALGIDKTDPVDPVTTPTGDTDENYITLAIPAVAAATPSGDYDIAYKVVDKDGKENTDPQEAGAIKIPLGTGTYTIKAVFTPAN